MDDFTYSLAYLFPGNTMVNEPFAGSGMFLTAWKAPERIYAYSSARPYSTRSMIARQFLDSESEAEWLFFLDSDMGFELEAAKTLFQAAHDRGPDVYGGLCFAFDYREQRPQPTIYFHNPDTGQASNPVYYPRDQLFEVHATGTAFLLIHRKVIEDIIDVYGPRPFEDEHFVPEGPWAPEDAGEMLRGNDIEFCYRARATGWKVWVHSGAKVDHYKVFPIGEGTMDGWKAQHGLET